MMRCDLATVVALLLSSAVIMTFCVWLFDVFRRKVVSDVETGRITQCPYCGNMMSDYAHKNIVICAVCHSYLEVRDENHGKKK